MTEITRTMRRPFSTGMWILSFGTFLCISMQACQEPKDPDPSPPPTPSRTYETLDRPDMQRLLFHPRKEAAKAIVEGARRVSLKSEDGTKLSGLLHVAQKTAPLILAFYGNGEIAQDYDAIGEFYRSNGLTFLVIDYRGYGASAGTPSASRLLADALWIFGHLDEIESSEGLKPRSHYVLGRSLGSAAAIEVASRVGDKIDGLILDSAFADTLPLLQRLGYVGNQGSFDEARDGIGNLEKIALVRAPVLLIHGEQDQIIPIQQAEKLLAAAQSRPQRLLRIPKAGHNNLMLVDTMAYFAAIQDFTRSTSRDKLQEKH